MCFCGQQVTDYHFWVTDLRWLHSSSQAAFVFIYTQICFVVNQGAKHSHSCWYSVISYIFGYSNCISLHNMAVVHMQQL